MLALPAPPPSSLYDGIALEKKKHEALTFLAQLFQDFTLDDLHEEFWTMYKAAAQHTSLYDSRQARSNLIHLYERLRDLITAGYFLKDTKSV